MRIQDIKLNEYYRLKDTWGEYCNYYGWVKVIEIYKKGQYGNPHKFSCVKCRHIIDKTDTVGFVRWFRPMELIDTKGK